MERRSIVLPKTVRIRRDATQYVADRDFWEQFLKDNRIVSVEQQEDGQYVVEYAKIPKCKNCVWWVALNGGKLGACGEEDLDVTMRKVAAKQFECEADDLELLVVKFVHPDDKCGLYRRLRRTWGGNELDERRSVFLD